MRNVRFFFILWLVSLLAGAWPALASAQEPEREADALPPVANEVPEVLFFSGGVGEEDDDALTAEAARYVIKLLFVGEGGMYLSDVAVNVLNAKGEWLASAVTDGPVLFLQLPPGKYTVEAALEGEKVRQRIQAPAQGMRAYHIRMNIRDNIKRPRD